MTLTTALPTRRQVAPTGIDTAGRTFPVAWWGMAVLIATEAMIFAGLLSAYFFLRAASDEWPPPGIEAPELKRIGVFTVLLLASSIPVVLAERAVRRDDVGRARWLLALSWVMGFAFLAHQGYEYEHLGFGPRDSAYASLFYVITGLHGLHVIAGLAMSVVVQAKAWTGRIGPHRHLTLRVFGMYWHFVDAVWVAVFTSLYLAAHWGTG